MTPTPRRPPRWPHLRRAGARTSCVPGDGRHPGERGPRHAAVAPRAHGARAWASGGRVRGAADRRRPRPRRRAGAYPCRPGVPGRTGRTRWRVRRETSAPRRREGTRPATRRGLRGHVRAPSPMRVRPRRADWRARRAWPVRRAWSSTAGHRVRRPPRRRRRRAPPRGHRPRPAAQSSGTARRATPSSDPRANARDAARPGDRRVPRSRSARPGVPRRADAAVHFR